MAGAGQQVEIERMKMDPFHHPAWSGLTWMHLLVLVACQSGARSTEQRASEGTARVPSVRSAALPAPSANREGTSTSPALPCGVHDALVRPDRDVELNTCSHKPSRASLGVAFEPRVIVWVDVVVPRVHDMPLQTMAAVDEDLRLASEYFVDATVVFMRRSYTIDDDAPTQALLHCKDASGKEVDSFTNHPIFRTRDAVPLLYSTRVCIKDPMAGEQEVGGITVRGAQVRGIAVGSVSNPAFPLLAHELGHFLGLEHTLTCGADGDGVDDTPYDPGPHNISCETGKSLGSCGTPTPCTRPDCQCTSRCTAPNESATPDGRNLMDGFWTVCDRFTPGQIELIRCNLRKELVDYASCRHGELCGSPIQCKGDACGDCATVCSGKSVCVKDSCKCTPACQNKCGDDGCGGKCSCTDFHSCKLGKCVPWSCAQINGRIAALSSKRKLVESALKTAAPPQKPALAAQVASLSAEIELLKGLLGECS